MLVRELKEKLRELSRHSKTMDLIDAMTNRNIRSVREKSSLNRRMCIRFESRKICVAGNECDESDFDFHKTEHKELPVIKISFDEGSEDCQQLKPKGLRLLWELLIPVTILLIPSILFSRVTVNVLARCIFHACIL